ncbi:MAG: hypothetical protein WED04_00045 [Promethearchaeati archaeon SRVP18_Atabeyarchaeia-1]
MEYEIYQIKEDGSKLEVPVEKINEALVPCNVVILIDHTRRKIYNFNGRESGIRVRFIGARMAAGPIRGELGLTYTVNSIDEGEETNEFRDFVKSVTNPGSVAVSRILDRPPPPPLPLRSATQKTGEAARRPSSEPSNALTEASSSSPEKEAPYSNRVSAEADCDVTSLAREFGETPQGYEVEAIILKDAVYKNVQVQTKVFGKEVEQVRLERVNDVDGLFTMDGQIRVIAKNGAITGIQIMSKGKATATKKPKAADV